MIELNIENNVITVKVKTEGIKEVVIELDDGNKCVYYIK